MASSSSSAKLRPQGLAPTSTITGRWHVSKDVLPAWLTGVFLIVSMAPAQAGVPLTKDELLEALKDADHAINNLTVTYDYTAQYWAPNRGMLPQAKGHGTCILDFSGRFRYEGYSEAPDKTGKPQRESAVAVFDGKRLKVLEGTNEHFMRGKVNETPTLPWPLDPREFLSWFFGRSAIEYLKEEGSSLAGTVPWKGRSILAFETKEFTDAKGDRAKTRFLVDCDLGFRIVRRSIAIYRPKTRDWFDYAWIESDKFAEVVPGVWLPENVEKRLYGRSSTVLAPQLITQIVTRNGNWLLNSSVSSNQFDFSFPPGILITDEQSGRIYNAIDVKNRDIASQAMEGIEIYREDERPNHKRIWYLILGGIGACLGGVSAFLLLRRGRRGRV